MCRVSTTREFPVDPARRMVAGRRPAAQSWMVLARAAKIGPTREDDPDSDAANCPNARRPPNNWHEERGRISAKAPTW
jgi:hypothetical protein